MTPEDWEELMEAPGGENHGRRKGPQGGWVSNEAEDWGSNLEYIVHVPIHGLRSTYVQDGCRCRACRRANAEYFRKRITRNS